MKKKLFKILSMLLILSMLTGCLTLLSGCYLKAGKPDESGYLLFYKNQDRKSYAVDLNDDCPEGAEVVIPDTFNGKPVTAIVEDGFSSGIAKLKSLSVPDSIQIVGRNAFAEQEDIFVKYGNSWYLGNENNPYVILVKTNELAYTGPEGLQVILADAFDETVSAAVLPKTVTYIDPHAFSACSYNNSVRDEDGNSQRYDGIGLIAIDEANEHYVSVDNVLYNKAQTRALYVGSATHPTEVKFSDTVEFVEPFALGVNPAGRFGSNEEVFYVASVSNPYFMLVSGGEQSEINPATRVLARGSLNRATAITVPASVVQIHPYAFSKNLETATVEVASGWFDADIYFEGKGYDLSVLGSQTKNKQIIYCKEGDYKKIARDWSEENGAYYALNNNNTEWRRYESK